VSSRRPYDLLAIDLDGTLLDSGHALPPANRAAREPLAARLKLVDRFKVLAQLVGQVRVGRQQRRLGNRLAGGPPSQEVVQNPHDPNPHYS